MMCKSAWGQVSLFMIVTLSFLPFWFDVKLANSVCIGNCLLIYLFFSCHMKNIDLTSMKTFLFSAMIHLYTAYTETHPVQRKSHLQDYPVITGFTEWQYGMII
jgi:hypothetical protein